MDEPESTKIGKRNLRRIASNAASMLASNLLIRGTTLILYALVARYLGVHNFGQLALALALFHFFQVLAVAGLKTLITREVSKDHDLTDRYLVNASAIVLVLSLITTALVSLFARVMDYAPDTTAVIVLLSLGLLPYTATQVCEGIFQAREKMKYIAYANAPISIVKVSASFLLLSTGHNIYHLAILIVISHFLVALIEWGLVVRYIVRPRARFDVHFSYAMIKSTAPFLGIEVAIALRSSLSAVLLSKLATEVEVGLYSAAVQLMVPVRLILDNLVASVFPAMCRNFQDGLHKLRRVTENFVELLMVVALPAAVSLYILAEPFLLLLYEDKNFVQAAIVIRITVWILLLDALKTVFGQALWASQKEFVSLRIAILNTVIATVSSLIFISQFGLIGASLSVLLVTVANFSQHYLPVSKLFPALHLPRLIWKSALAAACMSIALFLVVDQQIGVVAVSALLLYVLVLGAIFLWTAGGYYQFKTQYLSLWS